jgi:hypothetical protein
MAEWSNAAVLKTVDRVSGPGVRIPLPPQNKNNCPRRGIFVFRPLPNSFEQWGEKKNDKGVSPAIVFVLSGA